MTGDYPLIRLEGLSKAFGPIYANREITLDIHAGKIKSLLGENGAGKSTLMGMLAGRLHPDGGRILIDGRPRLFGSARDAIDEGIGMVYQHFMLVEAMTVAENIFLGHTPVACGSNPKTWNVRWPTWRGMCALISIPPHGSPPCPWVKKQRVEILKLLFRRNRVLIF